MTNDKSKGHRPEWVDHALDFVAIFALFGLLLFGYGMVK